MVHQRWGRHLTDDRLRVCLARLAPHLDRRRVALTGGVAIGLHAGEPLCLRRGDEWSERDVDFVADGLDAVAPSVAGDFLVSHFHVPQRGYAKFMIQLVDTGSRLRVDVFPDSLGALPRATAREVAGVSMLVLAPGDILDHKVAVLARASKESPDEEKHYRDVLLLAELCGRQVPAIPASFLVERPSYSQDLDAMCARCEASRSPLFPLAPKRQIHDILGYV